MATVYTPNYNFELVNFDTVPWHKKEHNNWSIADAVFANFIIVSNLQGVWLNATAVTVGQKYVDVDLGTIWTVLVAHTTPSTGTFAASRTAVSANWEAFTVQVTSKGAWTTATVYSPNDFVQSGNLFGVVQTAYTSGATYAADVTAGNIITLVDGDAIVTAAAAASAASEAAASASETAAAASATAAAASAATCFMIAVTGETETLTTGTAKITFRMPFGLTLKAGNAGLRASVNTVSSSGIPTIDVNVTGTGTILSTKLTIDASEKTSLTADAAVVLSTTVIADDAEVTVDIDTAGTGAKGLKLSFIGDPT